MSWTVDVRGRVGSLDLEVAFETRANPVVVIGPNGAGKTTLLRIIAGARTGCAGRVQLRGRTLMDTDRGVDAPPHERRVGYVPQGYGLFPHLSVEANVAFGCGRGREARESARAALDRLDALALAKLHPLALSGGEKQKVALARALAPEPEGLLLDEPLAALDPRIRRSMRAFLARYLTEVLRPTIVVTHDHRDVRALGGTVLVLEEGRVVQSGSLNEISAAPATDFVEEFLDALPVKDPPSATASPGTP